MNRANVFSFGDRRDIAISTALFIVFGLVYGMSGTLFVNNEARFDFFGADIDTWFGTRDAEIRHPLLPLFGAVLMMPTRYLAIEPIRQALVANACLGAAAVVLAYQVFRRLLSERLPSGLLAILYGVSMCQLVVASVLDSYAASSFAINTTYLLFLICLVGGRTILMAWVPVAVLSLGISLVTVAQTAVAFTFVLRSTRATRPVWRAAGVGVCALATASVLIGGQTAALRTRNLFSATVWHDSIQDMRGDLFKWEEESSAPSFEKAPDVRRLMWLTHELGRNLYLFAFVGGQPGRRVYEGEDRTKIEYFGFPTTFGIVGFTAAALWLTGWVSGVATNARVLKGQLGSVRRTLFLALLAILSGNTLLLAVYNPVEMFLYAPLTAFPILLLGVNPELMRRAAWQFGLSILIVLVFINNVGVILQMLQ